MADDEIIWSGVTEPMARQILAQGEAYLQAQLQSAIASDSRATSMSGLFVTLALAAVGAGLGYWQQIASVSPLLSGLTAGGLLTAAAALSAWAGRPIDFFYPGNEPRHWFGNRTGDLVQMLGGEAENYDKHIAINDRALGDSQIALRRAYKLGIAAPIAGAVAWLLPLICLSSRG